MEKARHRLMLSCYIFILILAGLFYLASLYFEQGEIKSYLLSLSSGCAGTVFFFFIFKFFMSDSDSILLEKIDSMISTKILSTKYDVKEKDVLAAFFTSLADNHITNMYFVGYSMAHIFQQYQGELICHLRKGAKIKVILIDPISSAGKVMEETVGSKELVIEPHHRSVRYIRNINEKSIRNKIGIRKVSWIPSCSIIYAVSKQNFYAICMGINGFVLDHSVDRRLYTISVSKFKDDKMLFFESHIEKLWTKGVDC